MAKILLVEDDELNREMLTERLGDRGYEVVIAEDGPTAVAMAASAVPDLILMDGHLPGYDGAEATRRIKATPALAAIPLIMLTSNAMVGDRESAIASGADEYETKPIDFVKLLAKIVALIAARSSSDTESLDGD